MKQKAFHSCLILCFILIAGCLDNKGNKADLSKVPGTVISHLPASTRHYLGSPSIVISPAGEYIVSFDMNSWSEESAENEYTIVYRSGDKGKTWEKLSDLDSQQWSSLFYHRGELYIAGTRAKFHDLIIQKSMDGGRTWTEPLDENTGLIARGKYHCAPVPVIEYAGRIWRGIEIQIDDRKRKQALVMSAPVDSDLLKSSSWTLTDYIKYDEDWMEGTNGWIEGNMVVTPQDELVNIIRVQTLTGSGIHGLAAMIQVEKDGSSITFDPEKGFISMPGGSDKKFTIRFDSISGKYWSLVNWIHPDYLEYLDTLRAGNIRNTLALASSPDLTDWEIERIVLQHPDIYKHGFQYADWVIEGSDMVAVIRTGYDDGLGGPRNYHDANFIIFVRVESFREDVAEGGGDYG